MDFRSASNFNKIKESLDKINSKFQKDDDTFWRPEVDKAGDGYAEIRFLPTPPQDGDEGVPFVKLLSYSFQGPTGQWYIENSPKTLDNNAFDPVAEANARAWKEGEAGQAEARGRTMRKQFVANVYIVDDGANPENNGKVFRWRFPKKIMDKIDQAMNPKFKGDEPLNPFDLLEGANFKIRIKTVESGQNSYLNYDDSSFKNPAPLFKNDEKLNEIWQQSHSLLELVSPDKFKSEAELRERFASVMGLSVSEKEPEPVKKTEPKLSEKIDDEIPFVGNDNDDVEDDLEYFKKLASS